MTTCESVLRRPATLLVGLVAAIGLALWSATGEAFVDLDVYRAGGEGWLAGSGLYTGEFPPRELAFLLPFTYPPFAAILFTVFGVPPLEAMGFVLTAMTALAIVATCAIVARHTGMGRRASAGLGAAVGTLSIFAEPVLATIDLGQINALLMLMVVADCLLPRTPWPRGVLIGIAAGIKLTPAVFLLYFLLSRRWRPALTALATFAGTVAAGFLLAGKDSTRYWFTTLFNTDRIGGPEFATNQALRGVLGRYGLVSEEVFPFWLAGVVVLLAVTCFAVRRLHSIGAELPAMLVVALAGLLCSPVSWSNHWVWAAPAAVWLLTALIRNPKWSLLAPGIAVGVLFLGPHRFVPRGEMTERDWTPLEQLLGNGMFFTAVAVLAVTAVLMARGRRAAPAEPGDRYARQSNSASDG